MEQQSACIRRLIQRLFPQRSGRIDADELFSSLGEYTALNPSRDERGIILKIAPALFYPTVKIEVQALLRKIAQFSTFLSDQRYSDCAL
ncbi:hypothetical protein [Pajaroellobacter abortibovis]|uniref:Uncharacterized protein n=1 Tax=Pajaroellobacter abortibovis TaxID=1882918 RepID=A0A1L6MW50_9BACT|nr:hypothetical protein [Pajaroellobacter abortibovis]APR99770.1 hypothetical protein BCY86_03070 [Pajaroellobacter abortibovis]